jgi:hypothetical protein
LGELAEWLRERCRSGPFTRRGLAAELAKRITARFGCSCVPKA